MTLPQPRPTLDPNLLSPLINGRDPLTGAPSAPPGVGAAYPPPNVGGQEAGMAEIQPGVDYDPMTGRPIPKRRGRGDASYGKM
jgi:hypothetical protein